jgi:hypothetical protein
MNTFLIVVVMALTAPVTFTDLYIIQQPTFEGQTACVDFVKQNYNNIVAKAELEYPNKSADNVYCVSKDKIEGLSQNLMINSLKI